MLLAEWRAWWADSGENELRALLIEKWDPVREDPVLRSEFEPQLLAIARCLHEGGTRVDIHYYLSEFRATKQGRIGSRWVRRDRRVAEKIVRWYRQATGEGG